MRRSWLAAVVFIAWAQAGFAAVRLPAVFSDHMVLQQQMPLTVWSWAEPGERVEVEFRSQRVPVTADRDGRWSAWLGPETAGGPFELTVRGASTTRRFADVLVGEVWIASGQSNMQWTVARAKDAAKEIADARHPRIRMFSVRRVTSSTLLEDVSATAWVVTTPETIQEFSEAKRPRAEVRSPSGRAATRGERRHQGSRRSSEGGPAQDRRGRQSRPARAAATDSSRGPASALRAAVRHQEDPTGGQLRTVVTSWRSSGVFRRTPSTVAIWRKNVARAGVC